MGILRFVSLNWKREDNQISKNNAPYYRQSEKEQGLDHQSMMESASENYFIRRIWFTLENVLWAIQKINVCTVLESE